LYVEKNITVVDMQTGTGSFTVSSGAKQIFHFISLD